MIPSAYNIAYGFGQLPAGWAADKAGPRLLIAIGLSGVAACGLLVGVAPTYVILLIAMILMGLLGGCYHPSASPIVADSTPVEKRGRSLGVHQVGGTLANFITPFFAAGIAAAFSWRESYLILSVPIIIFGVVVFILLRRSRIGGRAAHNKDDSTISESSMINRSRVFRISMMVLMGTLIQIFIFATLGFVTIFVVDNMGGSQQIGAAFYALSQFAGIWAGPLGGHLSDKLGKTKVLIFATLMAGPLIFLLGIDGNWISFAAILLALGACMYMSMPVVESFILNNTSVHNRSSILGVYYFASRGGPGLLALGMGKGMDIIGFGSTFMLTGALMTALALILTGVIFIIRRRQP